MLVAIRVGCTLLQVALWPCAAALTLWHKVLKEVGKTGALSHAHCVNQGLYDTYTAKEGCKQLLDHCKAAEHRLAGMCAAQCLPLLGHMHPPFFKIMDEIQDGLRYLFQTDSKYVCLMSGTGHAGA